MYSQQWHKKSFSLFSTARRLIVVNDNEVNWDLTYYRELWLFMRLEELLPRPLNRVFWGHQGDQEEPDKGEVLKDWNIYVHWTARCWFVLFFKVDFKRLNHQILLRRPRKVHFRNLVNSSHTVVESFNQPMAFPLVATVPVFWAHGQTCSHWAFQPTASSFWCQVLKFNVSFPYSRSL